VDGTVEGTVEGTVGYSEYGPLEIERDLEGDLDEDEGEEDEDEDEDEDEHRSRFDDLADLADECGTLCTWQQVPTSAMGLRPADEMGGAIKETRAPTPDLERSSEGDLGELNDRT
jgi:hypothetical protein